MGHESAEAEYRKEAQMNFRAQAANPTDVLYVVWPFWLRCDRFPNPNALQCEPRQRHRSVNCLQADKVGRLPTGRANESQRHVVCVLALLYTLLVGCWFWFHSPFEKREAEAKTTEESAVCDKAKLAADGPSSV
jgi:hypothetical protein